MTIRSKLDPHSSTIRVVGSLSLAAANLARQPAVV
jgi:hypothetical protein